MSSEKGASPVLTAAPFTRAAGTLASPPGPTTTRPRPYKVPYDGPGGDLLRALGRDAWRPAHLHVIAEAPGYTSLVTEIFLADEEFLDCDAVFGVREDLIVNFTPSQDKLSLPSHLAAKQHLPETFLRAEVTIRLTRS